MGAVAAAAGVRTPALVFVGPFGNGAGLLIQQWVDGVALDQVDHRDLDLANQVAALHAAGIAHGDLGPHSVLVDAAGQAWLVDFSRADAADDAARAEDDAALARLAGNVPPRVPAVA